MAGQLTGPSVGLPFPQALYPASLTNATLTPSGNTVSLAPGQTLALPRKKLWVSLGGYAVLQFYDPVTTTWRSFSSSRTSPVMVDGDGFDFRVANLTGCAIAAIVTNAGSSYVQGSTTATPASGNSTWQPIVGGLVNTTVSITASGAGYGIAPLCFIPPPPPPGVCASAVAVIASGTVSSITIVNQGAGYQGTVAPVISIYPNPTDPNFLSGAITSSATASLALTGSGKIGAILCTNPGATATSVPSLTIAGAGSSAAATIVPMLTLTGITVASGGAGYSAHTMLTTIGGIPTATATWVNPAIEMTGYIPRPAQALLGPTGTIASITTIYDGGLFTGAPTALVLTDGIVTTIATITLASGSVNASVEIQDTGA